MVVAKSGPQGRSSPRSLTLSKPDLAFQPYIPIPSSSLPCLPLSYPWLPPLAPCFLPPCFLPAEPAASGGADSELLPGANTRRRLAGVLVGQRCVAKGWRRGLSPSVHSKKLGGCRATWLACLGATRLIVSRVCARMFGGSQVAGNCSWGLWGHSGLWIEPIAAWHTSP